MKSKNIMKAPTSQGPTISGNSGATVSGNSGATVPIGPIGFVGLTFTLEESPPIIYKEEAYKADSIRFRIETITDKDTLVKIDGIYIDYEVGTDVISISSEGEIAVNGEVSKEDIHKNSIINKLSEELFSKINISTLKKMRELVRVIEKQKDKLDELNEFNFTIAEKLSKYERVETWEKIESKDSFEKCVSVDFSDFTPDNIQTKLEEVKSLVQDTIDQIKVTCGAIVKYSGDDKNEPTDMSAPHARVSKKRRPRRRNNPILGKP